MSQTQEASGSAIDTALRQFEAAEANLEKLERVYAEAMQLVPKGISFGSDPKYETLCRDFEGILAALPKIDGWKPQGSPPDLNELAQSRLDASDIDEISAIVAAEDELDVPRRELAEYRHRLNKMRRSLVREAMQDVIAGIDSILQLVRAESGAVAPSHAATGTSGSLLTGLRQIEVLLGSSVARPSGWDQLSARIASGDVGFVAAELWPAIKATLVASLYQDNEPIPVEAADLGILAAAHPRGAVGTRLNWERLTAEDFERLVFGLISGASGYENPEWLMNTNAPDRGRDLSVVRVVKDQLGGVIRSRVMIQCRHWSRKSVSPADVAELKEQMAHWEPPRVDVLVIATTSRFTADAVSLIETHNRSDRALRIEMWPETHLERLLSERPGMIAEFRLR
jgi:Restriction endonuclease